MRGKSITVPIMVLILLICLSFATYAHPGRTDSNGGHYDYDAGEYHYHHGETAHYHYESTTKKAVIVNNVNKDTIEVKERYYLTYTEKTVIKSLSVMAALAAVGFAVYEFKNSR